MTQSTDRQIRKEIRLGEWYAKKHKNLTYEKIARHFGVKRYVIDRSHKLSNCRMLTPDQKDVVARLCKRAEHYQAMATMYSMKTLAKTHHKGYREMKKIAGTWKGEPSDSASWLPVQNRSFLTMRLTRNPCGVTGYY